LFSVIPLGSIASMRPACCGFELIFCAMGLRRSLCGSIVVVVIEPVVVEPEVVDPGVVARLVVLVVLVVPVVVVVDVFGLPCAFEVVVDDDVVLLGLPCVFGAIVADEVIVRGLSCFGPELGALCVVVTVCGFPRVEFPPPRPLANAGESDSVRLAAATHETVRSRICASAIDERNRCAAPESVAGHGDTILLRRLDRQNWQVVDDWGYS